MRKLQELALGGVGGGSSGSKPSTHGRQLLYWESLKSKVREGPSMSWRGSDEFAHEMPKGAARKAVEEQRQQPRSARTPSHGAR